MSKAQLDTREHIVSATDAAQLTVGVEEEFLLVDVKSGRPADRAQEILARLAGEDCDLQAEITLSQVESATSICHTMDELREQLTDSRRLLSSQAERHGAWLVASGAPVLARALPNVLTPLPRYHRMTREFRALIGELPVCGCHVHIGLPDDDARIVVSNHLRFWLPTLLDRCELAVLQRRRHRLRQLAVPDVGPLAFGWPAAVAGFARDVLRGKGPGHSQWRGDGSGHALLGCPSFGQPSDH